MNGLSNKTLVRIDIPFLYKLRPEYIMFLGVAFFCVVLLLSPINVKGNISTEAFLYLFLNIVAFISGCLMIRAPKSEKPFVEFYVKGDTLRRLYRFSFTIAIIAIGLKIYDSFFIRGISWTASTLENSELIYESRGNIFSVLASILVFTTYLPITIDMLAKGLNPKKLKFFAGLILFYNCLDCIATGSRFSLVRPIVYFVLLLGITGGLKKISLSKFLGFFVATIIVVSLIGELRLRRMSDMNMDVVSSIASGSIQANKSHTRYVPVNDSFKELMIRSKDKWYYTLLYSYTNMCQYLTHAVFEFTPVMEYVDKKGDFFYGKSTFMVYGKFWEKVFGSDTEITNEINKHNLRPGIWSTFFFSWYLDFGWMGILLFFFVGYFTKFLWYKVYYHHNILFVPIVLFQVIVWALTLQLNYIQGSGTYAITLFLSLPLFFKLEGINLIVSSEPDS